MFGIVRNAVTGRISYVFGLTGPCMAIDTACSSGLVAIANAHNALMLGAIPAALAGGVNLLLSPGTHAMYAVAGISSSTAKRFQPAPSNTYASMILQTLR